MDTITAPVPITRAIVDLSAFRSNLDAVRSYVGPSVRIMAVVKADGYGHGMIPIAREAEAWGVSAFGVARIQEGIELRRSGTSLPILVFEALPHDAINAAVAFALDVTVTRRESAADVAAAACCAGRTVGIHVKVDTGMGRLGFAWESAADEVERIAGHPGIELKGVYTHCATSEDPDQSYLLHQLERFRNVLDRLEQRKIPVPLRHMANSGAIMTCPDTSFDMVRPGIMLYGYPPGRGMTERFPVKPVMSLKSAVAFVKQVPAGTSISYGRKFITRTTTTIASVPIGYADGFSRALSNNGEVLVRGRRVPLVGTVCMDQIMLDLGPDGGAEVGDEVTLIGTDGRERIDAWDLGGRTGTIPYEVTCLITRRVPRLYEGRSVTIPEEIR
jgi:alanine racemase